MKPFEYHAAQVLCQGVAACVLAPPFLSLPYVG